MMMIMNQDRLKASGGGGGGGGDSSITDTFLVNAAKGLLRSISLGTKRYSSNVLQDMLSLLSVWFRHGHVPEVYRALDSGLGMVHIDTWLGVLPQLIARLDHPEENARKLLHALIIRLGNSHAQALVYPLSVAVKSPRTERKLAAESLMISIRQHNEKLIDQALLVSHELIRVAILWEEIWHEVLEEASRLYFGEGNVRAMLDLLLPKHELLSIGPTTLRESSFIQYFGNELSGAWESLRQYISIMSAKGKEIPTSNASPQHKKSKAALTEDEKALALAWEIYYSVFKKINQSLRNINTLEFCYVSPSLQACRNLTLGVPGTYSVDGNAVKIVSFKETVQVIKSKQRPRKIVILGEDGNRYAFLLKGHEDLRQDERAMQLFGLVNALLYHDRRTENDDLSIQRYAVVPLSPTVIT
jgi:FKBP12-rapamycin complex-associated protein